PRERHVVVAPLPRDRDRNLVVRGAVEDPVVAGGDQLNRIHRVRGPLDFDGDEAHGRPPLLQDTGTASRSGAGGMCPGTPDPGAPAPRGRPGAAPAPKGGDPAVAGA